MQLCPEEQLLVQCSRVALSEEAVARTRETLDREMDWDYVLEASIRHGTAPLLHHGLEMVLGSGAVRRPPPKIFLEDLRRLYAGNRARNRRLYEAISQIAAHFHRHGIQAIGLKDLQLAWEVYPDIGLRTMGDIDLLIQRADYPRVARCMEQLGFCALPSGDIPYTLKYAWAHHFHRAEDNLWIDLQWNVVQREWDIYGEGNFNFEIDRVWRQARTMTIHGSPLLAPCPEDMLFHLCLHLEGHQYSELILFSDIDAFVAYYGENFDWEALTNIARRYRAESSIYYVLLFTKILFGSDIPGGALSRLSPRYFDASLFQPLFENLTSLHLSLDDMRLASAPPDFLLRQWETQVRRQAVAAMQVFRELDGIAREFTSEGSAPIAFFGSPSDRIFPYAGLQPFRDIHAIVLEEDLPRLERTLGKRGFGPISSARSSQKKVSLSSRDPVLNGRPVALHFEAQLGRDLKAVVRAEAPVSKKRIALTCLKRKMTGEPASEAVPVTVKFLAASREQALVLLTTQIARQNTSRLFALCNLLQFFGGGEIPVFREAELKRAELLARGNDILAEHCSGLSALLGVASDGRFDPPRTLQAARIFEWARYGPEALTRMPGLKRAFYYLFTVLSLKGAAEKWRYISRSARADENNQRILSIMMRECFETCWSRLSSRRADMRHFAYWLDTDGLGAKPYDRHMV